MRGFQSITESRPGAAMETCVPLRGVEYIILHHIICILPVEQQLAICAEPLVDFQQLAWHTCPHRDAAQCIAQTMTLMSHIVQRHGCHATWLHGCAPACDGMHMHASGPDRTFTWLELDIRCRMLINVHSAINALNKLVASLHGAFGLLGIYHAAVPACMASWLI